jgi:hypothetical protein
MEHQLLELRLDHPKPDQWAQKAVLYLEKCLDRLQKALVMFPFQKRSEEIHFFKKVKPAVMAQLIFAAEVHNKETFRPFDPAEEKDYLADQVDEIDVFFKRHESLYSYYKDGLETLDIRFFVRQVEDRFNFRDLPIEIDPVFFYGQKDFSTGFDSLFAKFKAYELLRDHLENELEALLMVGDEVPPEEMNFTGSQADFVQLVDIFKQVGRPIDPKTGEPATDEQIFDLLKGLFKPNLPNGVDFDTLRLITGDSDLAERMAQSIDKLYKQWEDEEKDVDYNKDEEDEDQEDEDGKTEKD